MLRQLAAQLVMADIPVEGCDQPRRNASQSGCKDSSMHARPRAHASTRTHAHTRTHSRQGGSQGGNRQDLALPRGDRAAAGVGGAAASHRQAATKAVL